VLECRQKPDVLKKDGNSQFFNIYVGQFEFVLFIQDEWKRRRDR
jgi:hypothetical protein